MTPRARSTASVGNVGEETAARYLEAHGLTQLGRNFQAAGGEIDLIMVDGEAVVFVEVRYRRSGKIGGAAASIGAAKQRRLGAAAQAWRARHREWRKRRCRFDVVALTGSTPAASDVDVHWIRHAFDASA